MEALENNEITGRFNLNIDGKNAYIEYDKIDDQLLQLNHTFVPKELRGTGVGAKIIGQTLDYIKAREMKIIPFCNFITAYIKKNSQYKDLIKQ